MSSNTTPEKKKGKKRWPRILLEILVIIAIVFAIRAWQQKDMVSGSAPSFQSVLLDGKTVNLEDYNGKPLLIHFWADWCPFCKLEEGSITSLQKDYSVLTVAYQSGDKPNVIKHMKERNIENWPTIVDEDGRLAEIFGVKGVPASYIIDSSGNIRFTEVGLTSGWGLRARLWWAETFKKEKEASPAH